MKGKTGFFKTLRGGLFFKYFLSYFLVFSVPLLLTLFVYSSSARIISAQSSGQATSLLELLLCWLLGGLVGIGTLICAFCLGPFIQFFNGLVSERVLHYKPGGQ